MTSPKRVGETIFSDVLFNVRALFRKQAGATRYDLMCVCADFRYDVAGLPAGYACEATM